MVWYKIFYNKRSIHDLEYNFYYYRYKFMKMINILINNPEYFAIKLFGLHINKKIEHDIYYKYY